MTPRVPLRRLAASVACAVAVLVAVPLVPAGAQQESGPADDGAGLTIGRIDTTDFPLVRATVDGPAVSGELDDAFVVTEDGTELTADVVRLRTENLNVVVAIDVSRSMEGSPLEQSKAAVAVLLDELAGDVPVSVVSFGESAVVTHDFSTDRVSLRAAVDGLIAAGGTALFDGIDRGLAQLSAQGGTGALVVLADGGDSASRISADDVLTRLGSSGIHTQVVALDSPDIDMVQIRGLASAAGGTTTVADADGLAAVFRDVAAGLSGTYEIRWQSTSQGAAGAVSIALASDPTTATTTEFAHPEVRKFVVDVATDSRTVGAGGAFGADWIPLAAAFAVSAGAIVLIGLMRSTDGAVERRADRADARAEKSQGKAERRRATGLQDRLEDMSAHVLEKDGRGRSLDDTLDRAGIAMRANEFVVTSLAFGVVSLVAGLALFGFPFFVLGALAPVAGIPGLIKFKIARRRKKFVDQLGDTLQLMAGSLTAGYGLGQTLDSVARETDAPTSEEFQRVVMETRLGRSLEDSLDAMSRRIGAEDFNWVVDAIKIQASVGGNLSDIIQQVGETIRARVRIKRQVAALSAEGKISGIVLFTLPFGLFGFIYSSNPEYIKPMFGSGLGQVMLGAAAFMITVGGLWLKKLVTPDF